MAYHITLTYLEPQYDQLFGTKFKDRLTPEYHQMRKELSHPLWQIRCKGSAVRGFHFTERERGNYDI